MQHYEKTRIPSVLPERISVHGIDVEYQSIMRSSSVFYDVTTSGRGWAGDDSSYQKTRYSEVHWEKRSLKLKMWRTRMFTADVLSAMTFLSPNPLYRYCGNTRLKYCTTACTWISYNRVRNGARRIYFRMRSGTPKMLHVPKLVPSAINPIPTLVEMKPASPKRKAYSC